MVAPTKSKDFGKGHKDIPSARFNTVPWEELISLLVYFAGFPKESVRLEKPCKIKRNCNHGRAFSKSQSHI